MNREIKFRAWDGKRKRFSYFHFHQFGIDIPVGSYYPVTLHRSDDDEIYRLEYENIEFAQFTGLYDKNHNEIYEGDILNKKIYRDNGGNYNSMPQYYDDNEITVGFHRGSFSDVLYPSILSRLIADYADSATTNYEIVDNVFEREARNEIKDNKAKNKQG